MKKLTKLLSVFIIAGAVGTGVAGASACNSHTHNYGYTDREDGQHHSVQCDGCDEEFPDELHVDEDKNGKCDLCGGAVSGSVSTEDAVTGVAITGLKKVAVKGTLQLTATVTVTGNAAKMVTWSSSDNSKATVDATGKVTGVAEGQVTITATSTYDTTKKADYAIEVVPEGTVIEKSTYEKLLEKDNVRAKINVAATVGDKLTDDSTAEIYVKGSADNYENDVWIEYADEGGTKVLKQVSKTPDVKGTFNVYTIINPGPVKGEVEGVFTTKVSHIGTNGDMIVFNGNSNVNIAMAGSDKNGGTLKVTYNNGTAQEVPVTGVALAVNTYIEVYFKLNLTEGKMTLKIDGVTALDDVETGTTLFNYVQISSSNGAQRVQTTKDIVICGTPKTFEDSQTEAKALIDAELAKYNKADYTANAGELDAAVAKAKKAVDDAVDIAGVNQAVAECKADLKAVLKDADIDAARVKAVEDLKAAYPETRFTFENLTGDDEKYNNKQLYEAKIAEVTAALENKNTAAEMKEITDAAAMFLAGKTNSSMLELKVAEAKTALTAYATSFKETLTGENAEAQKVAVDAAVTTQSGLLESANQITEVNTKFEEAKAAIEKAATDVGKAFPTVKEESKTEIDEYCAANIGSVDGDTTYVGLINAAVTKYKGDIDALTEDTTENRTAVATAVVDAKSAIDCYIDNYDKQQEANAHRDAEAAKVKNDAVKAEILALDFTGLFKDITEVADRTTALANAEKQVNDLVASLATLQIAVSVGNGEICYVTYGTKLTLSDLRVSGFNVSSATLGGKAVPATPSDDEALTVYNAVTVVVTGKTPINGFNASEQWLYANLVDADKAIIADNNLFTASAKSFEKNTDGSLYQPTSGVTAFGAHGKNVVSLGNIATDANNKDNALTITVNCALTSLNVKVLVADSAGTKIRTGAGNLHIEVNGVQVATNAGADLIWGNGANDKLTDLKMGDIVTIWAEKPNSGGRFYIAEINAEADTSKIEKTVTVNWLDSDTDAAINGIETKYHYFATLSAPAAPTVAGKSFSHWSETKNGADAYTFGSLEGKTSLTLYAVFETADATLTFHDEDGTVIGSAVPAVSGSAFDEAKAPTAPTKPDSADGKFRYEFKGWATRSGEEDNYTYTLVDWATFTVAAGNTDLYAQFEEKAKAVTYSVDNEGLSTSSSDAITLSGSFNSGSAGWSGTIDGQQTNFTKAIRAGGDSGRSIKIHLEAGTKISIACGGNYGTNGASGDIWIGTASSTTSADALAKITATNATGVKTSSSLLEYEVVTGGDYYIIFGAGKPSIYAIIVH